MRRDLLALERVQRRSGPLAGRRHLAEAACVRALAGLLADARRRLLRAAAFVLRHVHLVGAGSGGRERRHGCVEYAYPNPDPDPAQRTAVMAFTPHVETPPTHFSLVVEGAKVPLRFRP